MKNHRSTLCRQSLFVSVLSLLALLPRAALHAADAVKPTAKPNILIFYLDDMGWAQPGCYGGKMAATSPIDASGVRFIDGYSSACNSVLPNLQRHRDALHEKCKVTCGFRV